MAKKILDLDAMFDRSIVRVNGTTYELRTNEELPPLTIHQLGRKGGRITQLTAKFELDDRDREELHQLPRDICAAVLIAPADVIDTLTPEQRWAVCQAFLFQRNPSLAGLVAMEVPPPATDASPTGAN